MSPLEILRGEYFQSMNVGFEEIYLVGDLQKKIRENTETGESRSWPPVQL